MWWFSPPSSQVAELDVDISQDLLKAGSHLLTINFWIDSC
jgi:hypothetical protein